ncbi:MAG: P63C domain-containing protein [Candidatus Acidiferrales bacterium]
MDDSNVTGRARGGKKRAEILSPEQRTEIAQKAALARWGEKGLRALHKGSFEKEFGLDVDCYVLDDPTKTAVISQTGMGKALGLSSRGNAFPRFLASRAMEQFIGAPLRHKIEQPLRFQWDGGGAQRAVSVVHGFDATLLIDVCKAIIAAESEGKLNRQQIHVARQAHTILGASAKAGIKGLVWALAGYNPMAEEVIEAFKAYVQEEARKYEREFPNELYAEWHRLYDIPVPEKGKPWLFKNLTVKHVYYPLAKSNGKILELLRALRAHDGARQKKLFQFLNDIGARALRMQLGRVLEMCESSASKNDYEAKIVERFGGQRELDFVPLPTSSSSDSAQPS